MAWPLCWIMVTSNILVYHNFENFNLDSGIILILATLYVYMKCYDLYKNLQNLWRYTTVP